MSLSKVIKSTFIEQTPFVPVTFEKFSGQVDFKEMVPTGKEDFRVFPLGNGGDNVGLFSSGLRGDNFGDTSPVDVETELPVILEEEAARRIQTAYHDGFREGKQQAEESLAKVSEALAKALLSTGGLREKVLQESEEDLLKLAVIIARKIIRQEVLTDRNILVNLVKAAVDLVSEGDEAIVRLNPDDYGIVAGSRHFSLVDGEKRRMTLKADETVPSGGCVVDTAMGSLDARLEAQLEELFRRLIEERSSLRVQLEKEGEDVVR